MTYIYVISTDVSDESSSSSDENSDVKSDDETAKFENFIKKEIDIDDEESGSSTFSTKAPKLRFEALPKKEKFEVWRCLVDEEGRRGDLDMTVVLETIRKASTNKMWTILMCSGGRLVKEQLKSSK